VVFSLPEKLARENVIYMYLTGMEAPDFRTICNFKIECKVLIAQAFLETINFAKSQGMVKLGHISEKTSYMVVIERTNCLRDLLPVKRSVKYLKN